MIHFTNSAIVIEFKGIQNVIFNVMPPFFIFHWMMVYVKRKAFSYENGFCYSAYSLHYLSMDNAAFFIRLGLCKVHSANGTFVWFFWGYIKFLYVTKTKMLSEPNTIAIIRVSLLTMFLTLGPSVIKYQIGYSNDYGKPLLLILHQYYKISIKHDKPWLLCIKI